MTSYIKKIVILGGGSAGWMTAAALSSQLDPKFVSITLVESDQIGTIGVGEATIPEIINFNRHLGIREDEFMKATHATFKLGIEFVDWGRKGDAYIHPFGGHGVDMNGYEFHQYWLRSRADGNAYPIDAYSMSAVASRQNRFDLPGTTNSPRSHIRYAYHFDATLYARYLRTYAEARGVRRVEGKVEEVLQAPESGDITALRLDTGETINGELFFDCTGFSALLIGKTLGVGYHDWSHWLPCDSAQAVPCAHAGPLLPYTRSTARTAGWQWRIPTQTRTGNGHIYSSAFMEDDEATAILLTNLDGEAMASPRQIRFKAGHRHAFWKNNCVAIGLSAGFLEPLESTSIYLIQEGISRFIALFPDASLPEVVRKEYNQHMRTEFEQVRDFIILHYSATERDDTPFWNYCRTMSIPDSLSHKIELFRTAGRTYAYREELFGRPSWIAVFLGQGIMPRSFDPVIAMLPSDTVMDSLDSMRRAMHAEAGRMPTHAAFLQSYCPAARA
ncbi:tryptophan halogenase family protein [Asticcacaulis sp. AC402]|uniref:tryptophan halogenase family protein n=1 Tax=Asticcacaulis sp. AC402 TaxID=1282361 RepID=UPI0003C3FE68|nr:tryptophan halogenase family protein [Asticcacaulis sp. AC402]ESQ74734.1 tryptophan halogenase [Asticcacaulis sp. AC402]